MWRLRTYDFLHLTALTKGSYLNIRYDHFYFILIPSFTKFFSIAQQPLLVQGLIIMQASLSHSDTLHSVWLLWTSDQSDADTSTWQHTTLTRERYRCNRRDSKQQSRQATAENPRLIKFGHWYQLINKYLIVYDRHRLHYSLYLLYSLCLYVAWFCS
jgi:hypothetical protein